MPSVLFRRTPRLLPIVLVLLLLGIAAAPAFAQDSASQDRPKTNTLSAAPPAQPQAFAANVPQVTEPLRIYTKPLEPFVMDTGDQLKGFSVELWAEVARRLNMPFRWIEKQKVSEILDAVKSGEGDVAIAGISMTPEREAQLDFTHPYFNAGLQIMTRAGADVSFDSVFRLIMNPALLQILRTRRHL